MTVKAMVRGQLAKRAPRLEEAAVRARWRRRNRDRAFSPERLESPELSRLLTDLSRDGIAIGRFDELFGSTDLFDELAPRAAELYEHAHAGGGYSAEEKSYLTKLLPRSFDADNAVIRTALHPNVLAVVNRYMEMRARLRTLDLWLTRPLEGPAVQTQLWHRDGDDVMNVKLFVLFTDVTEAAGPFCYAPGTHPIGSQRHRLPDRDEAGRSTDVQMEAVVPSKRWVLATGSRGTVVLADTCGYHKQLKPESDERLVLMVQYVSGTPNFPPDLDIRGLEAAPLTLDQKFALLDAP